MLKNLYIGVMSGTSMDSVDVAICEIYETGIKLISVYEESFGLELKNEILDIIDNVATLSKLGHLDVKLAKLFAKSINNTLDKSSIKSKDIKAIGLHGQTVWHEPANGFSTQLGCASTVATLTDIDVVADFRRKDIANGGQGAPFAPVFHKFLFDQKRACVLNLGGMANISILDENIGYDTGCANVLIDLWCSQNFNKAFDEDGKIAKSGTLNKQLLESMLKDPYFLKEYPKSTGRELFNKQWLDKFNLEYYKKEDVLRTLTQLSATSISNEIKKFDIKELIVCGGGVKNSFLIELISQTLANVTVLSSDKIGYDSQNLEAMLFAWLAYKRVNLQKVELSLVTGSKKNSILGGLYVKD